MTEIGLANELEETIQNDAENDKKENREERILDIEIKWLGPIYVWYISLSHKVNGVEAIFKEVLPEMFPDLMKHINSEIQKSQKSQTGLTHSQDFTMTQHSKTSERQRKKC